MVILHREIQMKSLIKSLSSIKLAIFLLIIITLASILGTLIPQERNPAEYAAKYGQIAKLFIRFEFTNLYHSWWYIAFLVLFALNTAVCTMTRFSAKWNRAFKAPIEKDKKRILDLKIHESFVKKGALKTIKTEAYRALTAKRFRIKESRSEDQVSLLGRKKILGIFGSDIVHLGILIILLGGIISGIGGDRQMLTISEGQVVPVPGAEFQLRLDKFETDYYANGRVKDWKSHLTVIKNDQPQFKKIVEVNHPLSHNGYRFYQSSYGINWENPSLEIQIKKKSDPSFADTKILKIGEEALLSGSDIKITAIRFIPDFILGENNQVATRSLQPNNPAVLLEGWQNKEKVFSGWVFAKFPDFDQMHAVKESDLAFQFIDIHAASYSGIQMSRDPGVNLIWIGCTFMMLGLFIAFYWPLSEIRIMLEENQDHIEITAGGLSPKNTEAFQAAFNKITTTLRNTK